MTMATTWDERVRQTCRALVPPLLLATPTGWQLIDQGDVETDGGVAASTAANERAARNARAVVDWVEDEAPTKLQTLVELVVAAGESDEETVSLQTKALIAATAARFVTPRRPSSTKTKKEARAPSDKNGGRAYSLDAWSSAERHLWASPRNELLAKQVVASTLLTKGDATWHADIVTELLNAYVRPLFSASTTNNINSATGRAKAKREAGSAPMEDEVLWKGGDVQGAAKRNMRLFGGEVVIASIPTTATDSDDLLSVRHAGIGSDCVVYACCQSLAVRSTDSGKDVDVWSEHWPLVLPPLMQLLEDPSPRFRLVGTQIMSLTVLAAGSDINSKNAEIRRQQRRIGTLLLRTGVAPLLRQALSTSMTFVTSSLAGALLHSTAEAWLRLISVTTAEMTHDNMHQQHLSHVDADGGRARYSGLSQLIDDGVLRVWAYAPMGMKASDLENASGKEDDAVSFYDDEEAAESTDVIDTSVAIVTRLTRPDALGVGIVRYLDVTLEFLTQQLLGIEARLKRVEGRSGDTQPTLSLVRETQAAHAIVALLDVSQKCPALGPWCGRCITAAARSWLLVEEGKATGIVTGATATALQKHASDIVRAMQRAQPYDSEVVLRQLLDLDEAIFAPFAAAIM